MLVKALGFNSILASCFGLLHLSVCVDRLLQEISIHRHLHPSCLTNCWAVLVTAGENQAHLSHNLEYTASVYSVMLKMLPRSMEPFHQNNQNVTAR